MTAGFHCAISQRLSGAMEQFHSLGPAVLSLRHLSSPRRLSLNSAVTASHLHLGLFSANDSKLDAGISQVFRLIPRESLLKTFQLATLTT